MTEENFNTVLRQDLLRMSADIVSAYVSQNNVSGSEIPEVINLVYETLNGVSSGPVDKGATAGKPAVAIRRSVMPDFIVCLEDGRKMKMLKRHLRTAFNLSPEQYRSRWGLPHDYPMVAPNYAKRRSDFAKKIGLGRREA
ncbi:MAG: MucR family transcriptional regulator [Proteobacteria bacterium]|nr:MucR family transcriptional regulator [Pseudomonadota bacterium]MDA1023203.1 MucR family transcriptional regulator [Pseudomonadota bacterium]